jgi:beta-glucosidase
MYIRGSSIDRECTTFAYESVRVSAPSVKADGEVQVTVKVKNTGKRGGDEVVQMYVQHIDSAVERPQLELKGFARVHIEPGASKSVRLNLKPRDLSYWDEALQEWRIEKESVRILAGASSAELPVHAILQVDTTGEYKP